MKFYHLLVAIPLFVACSSKDEALNHLNQNAIKFKNFANTEYLLNDKEIVYFTLRDDSLKIQLINRDRESENKIVSCTINKKSYPISEDLQSSWNNNYIIALEKPLSRAKIKCKLSDGRTIKKSIKKF